jgi:DeoR family transcriptional regulator of aga operon
MTTRQLPAHNLAHSKELPEQRHRWISATLHRSGAVSVREIVDRFGVSETTARRDIDTVGRSQGQRVYGGLLYTGRSH